ncbi:Hypothetical protein HVPorG_05041 (plasmid) [Roseomonas mucosa]|uniref:hypothetical protein n=1 Tax=Roseomonas mucosa TaxID=207340 RepID=UPI00220DB890|nr:hypothetical protein [Roseomonas mucosa]MDT8350923.1 hypothetical protein [Roseomonas mucosa]QDJ12076.1 Hypothetical protein HVPorG_05041 [Roseomonas mucosa]UZO94656.1 Hypothetical protein RMP42_05041 [Roseomonas mucosa]
MPILLEYCNGRLDGVTVETRHAAAYLGGAAVFPLGAPDALRLFERANGTPGRYRSDEAAFNGLAILLLAFSTVSARGEVRAAPPGAPGLRHRSVTERREPYRPPDEMDQFVTVALD